MRMMVPNLGQLVPVNLPDEITRGEVVEVRSDDEIVVCLNRVAPMAKTHSFKLGDNVPCRRVDGPFGQQRWEAQRYG